MSTIVRQKDKNRERDRDRYIERGREGETNTQKEGSHLSVYEKT
jgi:hypothetical protein